MAALRHAASGENKNRQEACKTTLDPVIRFSQSRDRLEEVKKRSIDTSTQSAFRILIRTRHLHIQQSRKKKFVSLTHQ